MEHSKDKPCEQKRVSGGHKKTTEGGISPGAVYDIASRGNKGKAIFLEDRGRDTFHEIPKDNHEVFGKMIYSFR